MSSRTRQCDGQLWLTFDWPKPTDRVKVGCTACAWTGQRTRRTATRQPCPRCAQPVSRRVLTHRPPAAPAPQPLHVRPERRPRPRLACRPDLRGCPAGS